MKRRAALLALACSADVASRVKAATQTARSAQAGAPSLFPLAPFKALLWGSAGVWIDGGDIVAQQLLDGSPAGVAAAPGVVWAARDARHVQSWRLQPDGRWAPAANHRFGEELHALAASADGRFLLAAHGEHLSLLDGEATLLRHYEGRDLEGRRRARAATIVAHPGRRSALVSWPALGELWEISFDPAAPPIFDGLVHDYRMGEAIAAPGYLGVRRMPLGTPMPEPQFVDARVPWVAGRVGASVEVVNLDVRRRVATLPLADAQPAAAVLRRRGDAWTWWLPAADGLHELDTWRWRTLERHEFPRDVDGPLRTQAMQARGETLWLLACDATTRPHLWLRRTDRWQRADFGAGRPFALRVDERALWLATSEPNRVVALNDDGALLQSWPLRAADLVQGLSWL